jgi:hypothetical protein
MASPDAKVALTAEIDALKKSRRTIEKDARKAIRAIMKSESPEKLKERRKAKKDMKEALVSTKKTLREKSKALSAIPA